MILQCFEKFASRRFQTPSWNFRIFMELQQIAGLRHSHLREVICRVLRFSLKIDSLFTWRDHANLRWKRSKIAYFWTVSLRSKISFAANLVYRFCDGSCSSFDFRSVRPQGKVPRTTTLRMILAMWITDPFLGYPQNDFSQVSYGKIHRCAFLL